MKRNLIEVKPIKTKTALVKCNIPVIDYVINPYIGCRFACIYCYASFMGRFVDKSISEWGSYVYPKINIIEILKKEVGWKLKNKGKDLEVFLSSVTDPYQGFEAKYKLTRGCLQVLADFEFIGVLSILTKSTLVLRDLELFKKFKNIVVGLTITATNDNISKYFEKHAPPVSQRIKALKKLNKKGIKTYAFVGPLLPHFVAKEKKLDKLFLAIAQTGTKDIYVEHLNLASYIRKRLFTKIPADRKTSFLLEKFYQSQNKNYRKNLENLVRKLARKYKLNLLQDLVIFHKKFKRESN